MNDTPELFPTSASSRDKPPGKVGGCVGTFLQFFDWNPRKRLFSTKRLPAERPTARKTTSAATKKKYKDERMPVAKLLLLADEENRGGFPSPKKVSSVSSVDRVSEDGATGKRVPGVVARLMGLESLPDERASDGRSSPQHPKQSSPVEVRPLQELLHTRQDPVLLSDLLSQREYLEAQRQQLQQLQQQYALKDRLQVPVPGFVKKLPVETTAGAGSVGSHANYNHLPIRDGFRRPNLRNEHPLHLQPFNDQKYNRNMRPLKKASSRDMSDSKHIILALSPRAAGDGNARPILLPSKAHNRLMISPIKSPTKMGSRSARLLEAAVKILEPNLQQANTSRPRVPPARTSSLREFRDTERDLMGLAEELRRESPPSLDRRASGAASSNAARVLKGQSMNRSWNGRDEAALRYTGGSIHDSSSSSRRRGEHQSHSKTSPMRASNRNRGGYRGIVSQDDMDLKVLEEIKTVVPQGFENTYGGSGLRPLNIGKRDEMRLDGKYDSEGRRISERERHIVSSLSSLSSLSVENSPYSECSDRSTTSSFHDHLRRSGSVKDSVGAPPGTPMASKSRFMRSKSVKEERSTSAKQSGSSRDGTQGSRNSSREMRVKQEIPQQAHQNQLQALRRAQQLQLQQLEFEQEQEQERLAFSQQMYEVSHEDDPVSQHDEDDGVSQHDEYVVSENDLVRQFYLQDTDVHGAVEAKAFPQPAWEGEVKEAEYDFVDNRQGPDVEGTDESHAEAPEIMNAPEVVEDPEIVEDLEVMEAVPSMQDSLTPPVPEGPSEHVSIEDSSRPRDTESSPAANRDITEEREETIVDLRTEEPAEGVHEVVEEREIPIVAQQLPRMSSPSFDESSSSISSSHRSSTSASVSGTGSHGSSPVSIIKEIPTTRNTTSNGGGGGLLSYSRLFGSRKSGDKKSSDQKEKGKTRDGPKKSESSLVRALLRRKPAPQPSTSPSPAPVQSMDKPKKRGGRKNSNVSGNLNTRDGDEAFVLANLISEHGSSATGRGRGFDMAAVIQANRFTENDEECKERIIHADSDVNKDSPLKTVDEVFPEVPLDKGCLRLLDVMDETGSQRLFIEGFDCVNEDELEESFREGVRSYAAHLMDDLKLEMFSSSAAGATETQQDEGASSKGGFSHNPLGELEEPSRSAIENGFMDGAEEVEKCVSFLGRTGDNSASSSPDTGILPDEVKPLPEQVDVHDEKPHSQQLQQPKSVSEKETDAPAIEEAKEMLLNELSEARKIVDTAFEEATERVAKKLAATAGRVGLAGADGEDEAICASTATHDDCGQPSPVSVLDCSFEEDESRSSQGNLLHEGPCEEDDEFEEDDEDALIDSLLLESASSVDTRPRGRKAKKKAPSARLLSTDTGAATTNKTHTEKLVDGLLDLSRVRDEASAERLFVAESLGFCPEEDEDYVSNVLSVWEVFPATNSDLPITSTLFDRLESQGRATAWKQDKERESEMGSAISPKAENGVALPARRSLKQWQGLWLHRRLLFDCVNETLAYSLKFKYPDPWMGIPVLRTPPTGKALVQEVYSDMNEWRDMQTEELDTVIEVDMGKGSGSWSNLTQEIGEIGLEIERNLLRVMIDDLVSEIMDGGCDSPSRKICFLVEQAA